MTCAHNIKFCFMKNDAIKNLRDTICRYYNLRLTDY